MDAEMQAKIDEMVRRIVAAVNPDKIILFGSHARGDAGPDSDVDLLIVAPTEVGFFERALPVYKALRGMGIPKDIIWATPDEVEDWSRVKSYVLTTAVREGKVLYEGRPEPRRRVAATGS